MAGEPLERAKSGTKRVFSKLGKEDCFSVVAFDSTAGRVVTLAPGGDRATIDTAIDALAPGGGTEFTAALEIARQDLVAAKDAKRKMVIFLTDGQAPQKGLRDLVDAMAADNIRVSSVGLGGAVDEAVLRMIADGTNGHLRKVTAAADLPRNLEEELAALRR